MTGWHLEYSVDVDIARRLVSHRIFGVWRADTARAFKRDCEEEIAPLLTSKKPWAKLSDLSNWKIGDTAMIDVVGSHLAWCREHGMTWAVYIINNPSTYKLLQKIFDKGGTREISRIFRTRDEAERFLRQQGWSLRPAGETALRRRLGL